MTNSALIREFRKAIGPESVLSAPSELAVYDCDAYTVERHAPAAVVFPRTTRQVAEVVRICGRHGCPVIARGAGTGLAGGCTPSRNGVVVALTRMNRILEIRLRDALAVVEPGVLNLQLARALWGTNYHYAPDPSSQCASTIGGNVATNAGGPHTLKYGVTVNHIAGLEVVLSDGSIVQLGPVEDPAAFDLASLVCGSEGTLGIVTKIWTRLTRNPQGCRTLRATFDSIDDASQAVSQIIAEGIIPAALELMDRGILDAVEEAFALGLSREAAAVLLIEIDGPEAGLDQSLAQVSKICRKWKAGETLQATTTTERELLWKCRKMAVGAVGRLSPGYVIQDGVVPRTQLPRIFRHIAEVAAKHRVRIVNVAHAGDGNVHPILLFDERDPDLMSRVHAASREILEECIASGGSITAEHGVGIEKIGLMEKLFGLEDIRAMQRVRQAFDPAGRLNPGKKFRKPDAAELPGNVQEFTVMNRVIDYQPDDMTITVEAGITLAELNRQLAARRQWLPIDAANPEQATIGSIIAANAFGPRRYGYGTVRDYLLGVRAIDGCGAAFSGGGRVVKNTAGYNIPRLMVGSLGTLGNIIQATFMVRPLPAEAAMVICDLSDFRLGESLLASLGKSQTRPVAVELLTGPTRPNCPLPAMPISSKLRIIAGFEGPADEVHGMTLALCKEWRALGGDSLTTIRGARMDAIWHWLGDGRTMMQINLLPSALVSFVEQLSLAIPVVPIQAHAGNGVIGIQSPLDADAAFGDFAALVRKTLRPMAIAAGGNLVVRAAPDGVELTPADVWGAARPGSAIMQSMCERFDPKNILNPGCFPA